MNSRRHADNFIPSQKSPIPLNRYDDIMDDYSPKLKPRPRSPEPRLVAKALYNFVGQSARELTFRKGDIIYIRRQVDKNWYEGEHNAMIGLFPANYVEVSKYILRGNLENDRQDAAAAVGESVLRERPVRSGFKELGFTSLNAGKIVVFKEAGLSRAVEIN